MSSSPCSRSRGLRVLGFLSLIAAAGFSGCATATRVPLAAEKRPQINSSQAIVGTRQQEIGTSINKSMASVATGGGLIGAIVDSAVENSRAKKSEAAVVPVRDALVGYNPGQVLAEALHKELPSVAWLKPQLPEARSLTDDTLVVSWVDQNANDLVLIVALDYRLAPDFSGLDLAARVSAFPRTEALRAGTKKTAAGAAPAIYFNTLITHVRMPGWPEEEPEREAAAALWAANKGEKARTCLDSGLQELGRMIAFDIQQDGPPQKALYKEPDGVETYRVPAITAFGVVMPQRISGYPLHAENGRHWLRIPTGELISMVKEE